MNKTPEVIRRLGIDEPGSRAIPRILFGCNAGSRRRQRYRRRREECELCGLAVTTAQLAKHRDSRLCRERRQDPNLEDRRIQANPGKQAFLALMISMIMHNALPQEGQKEKQHCPFTHEEIAQACGQDRRETITEWFQYFYQHRQADLGDESVPLIHCTRRPGQASLYTIARGRCRVEYVVEKAATGERVYGSKNRARAEHVCLEHNNKAGDNSKFRVVTREYPRERYYYPTLEQLCADPVIGEFWDSNAEGTEGYKNVPRWVWTVNEHLPLSLGARLVATYYFMAGILDPDPARKGQPKGLIEVHQAKVAAATGLSVSGVYYANLELEKLGIFRIFSDPKKQDGIWIRGPQKVLYLPIRQLTQEEANQERQRLVNCLHRVRDAVAVARAQNLHEELLRAWTGREHRIRAFWNALRRILLGDGLEPSVVNALIPRPPS